MKSKLLLVIGILLAAISIGDLTFFPNMSSQTINEAMELRYFEIFIQAVLVLVIIVGIIFLVHREDKNE